MGEFGHTHQNCVLSVSSDWRCKYYEKTFTMNIFDAKKLPYPALVCMGFTMAMDSDAFIPVLNRFLELQKKALINRLTVHGIGDQAFLKIFNRLAQAAQEFLYVGDSSSRWATVHRDDAANAFVLAVTKGPAGQRIHAVAEEVPCNDIAEMLGANLKVSVKFVSSEKAATHFTFLTPFVRSEYTAPPETTRERLG